MKISILIPAYNEENSIDSCLASIISNDYIDKEIIVINDASSDRTYEKVKNFDDVILLNNKKNEGITKAIKSGIKIAKGDIIVKIDADSIAPKDWLSQIHNKFLNKEIIVVGGIYIPINKKGLISRSISNVDEIFNNKFKRFFSVSKIIGTNWAARKSFLLDQDWDSISGDESIFTKLKPTQIVYNSNIRVYTGISPSLKGIWKRKFKWGKTAAKDELKMIKFWIRPIYFFSILFLLIFIKYDISKIVLVILFSPFLILFLNSIKKPLIGIISPFIFIFSEFAWLIGSLNEIINKIFK